MAAGVVLRRMQPTPGPEVVKELDREEILAIPLRIGIQQPERGRPPSPAHAIARIPTHLNFSQLP